MPSLRLDLGGLKKNQTVGTRQIAQQLKVVPSKQENQSSDTQNQCEFQVGMAASLHAPVLENGGWGMESWNKLPSETKSYQQGVHSTETPCSQGIRWKTIKILESAPDRHTLLPPPTHTHERMARIKAKINT